jgi:hypothetical protein
VWLCKGSGAGPTHAEREEIAGISQTRVLELLLGTNVEALMCAQTPHAEVDDEEDDPGVALPLVHGYEGSEQHSMRGSSRPSPAARMHRPLTLITDEDQDESDEPH